MSKVERHINGLVLKELGSYSEAWADQETNKSSHNTPSFFNGRASTEEEGQAYSPYVNWAKVWQLGIASGAVTPAAGSKFWGDWRNKELNHICNVHPDVQLLSNMTSIGFGFENKFSDDISLKSIADKSDKLFGKSVSSVFKTIESAASAVTAVSYTAAGAQDVNWKTDSLRETKNTGKARQKVISKYSNAAGWEGPSTLDLSNSSLTFTFRFGQAGLYDALEEVFKPIIALAALFQPVEAETAYSFNYLVPNSEYMSGVFLSAILNSAGDIIKETIQKAGASMSGEGNMFEKIAQKFSTPENMEQKSQELQEQNNQESQIETEKEQENPELTDKDTKKPNFSSAEIASAFQEGIKGALNFAADKAITLNTKIEEAKEAASIALLSASKMAYFKIGPFVIGPSYVKGVKVEFNSAFTDSQGIPTEGTITLNGIQLVYTASNENLRELLAKEVYTDNTDWESFDSTGGTPRIFK